MPRFIVKDHQEFWDAFALRWSRTPHVILTTPTDALSALLASHTAQIPLLDVAPPPPGTVLGKLVTVRPYRGAMLERDHPRPATLAETFRERTLAWPEGGVLLSETDPAPADYYEPLAEGGTLLRAVQSVRAHDPTSVLAFVNAWGPLGVGIPGKDDFPDGVEYVGEHLSKFQGWLAALAALQRGSRRALTWEDFARIFERELDHVRFGARPVKRGLLPRFSLRTLWEALCVHLWGIATRGTRLNVCRECNALFVRSRTDQIFCGRPCTNRHTVREWKRRHAKERRQQSHRQTRWRKRT